MSAKQKSSNPSADGKAAQRATDDRLKVLIQDIDHDLDEWQQITRTRAGKRAIVTGGSSGIGRGIALHLAENGYDLAITYHSGREEALAVGRYVRERFGVACHVLATDTGSESRVRKTMRLAIKKLGGVDLLVNNAGLTILDEKREDNNETLQTLIDVNFKGYLYGLYEVAPVMIRQGSGGSVISISSIHGSEIYPNDAIYGGMKAALERAMQTYALQYAENDIRINCIAPGWILIDRTGSLEKEKETADTIPLRRAGRPLDIARAVLFLASDEASYITGTTLLIDGGKALAGVNCV